MSIIKNKNILALLSVIAFTLSFPLQSALAADAFGNAANSAEPERYTTVTAVSEHSAVKPGDEITIATTIKLAPHWHVYWSNPGDSGLPVKLNWDLPQGFEISDIQWPTPDKISYDILVNYGYYNEVILLQTLSVPDTLKEGRIDLSLTADMLVCNEICIPETGNVSIQLNDPGNLDHDMSELVKSAEMQLPQQAKGQFHFSEAEGILYLSFMPEDRTILNDATIENADFFPADWGIINHATEPEVSIGADTVHIKMERGDQPIDDIEHLTGLLVFKGDIGENKAYDVKIKHSEKAITSNPVVNKGNMEAVKTPSPQEQNTNAPAQENVTLFTALYLALFGGMILNLMPCVFPVLSMKALSLVKMKDKENAAARMHGLAYTLGVILSFLVIGGALIILKEAGAAIGWGFQLQNPFIVAILAYLLFAVGLNLMGFFEFGSRFANVGSKLTQGGSLSSSFFTGTLATIVATPCTAPFMGVAMGFAITQPAAISLLVFATLGFGLALPYLLLAYIPAARHLLPKPGSWMNTFKQLLAFPMFASTIWLVWVLSQQAGAQGVLLALLGLLAIAFSVWLSHLRSIGIAKAIGKIAMIVSLILMSLTLSELKDLKTESHGHSYNFGSEYSNEKLSELLKGDEPIFVEMTAAWCITCKINHAAAININATKELFAEKNVQYLIGDWTNQDPTITEYLSSFGRNGVPLYVYYGKRDPASQMRPKEIVLPQVLTPAIVKQTIEN
ncbi:MAG: protein-disulfide reductase DsbD family protein [Alcanivorax sp.]